MKRCFFLKGFNAKIALFAVMVTGALLTGCYKDEGLDAEGPVGNTELPAATYTLNGTVIDAATMGNITLAADDYVKVDGTPVALVNGSFTVAVKPGDVVITAKVKGFNSNAEFSRTVKVVEVKQGQAVVYTQTIALKPNHEDVTEVAKYNVKVQAYGGEGLVLLESSRYIATITKEGSTTPEASFNGLEYGVYTVTFVENLSGGIQKTLQDFSTEISLSKVHIPVGDPAMTVIVSGYMPLLGDMTEYSMLYADFTNASSGNLVNVVKAWVTKNDTDVLESIVTNTSHFAFKVKTNEIADYRLNYTYTLSDGSQKTFSTAFAANMTTLPVLLNVDASKGATEVTPGEPVDLPLVEGETVKDVVLATAGTMVTLPNGETVSINDLDISIQRLPGEEVEEAVRVYEGTPDGIKFDKPIVITFKDTWDGQLGNMGLFYQGNNTSDGDVILKDGLYTMNVSHFSKFKADVAYESQIGEEKIIKDEPVSTIVGRKNDTEKPIEVIVRYDYLTGTEFPISIIDAVSTKFTGRAANVVSAIIKQYFENKGIVAAPFKTVSAEHKLTVNSWTCLEKISVQQAYNTVDYTFTINGKTVTVTVKSADNASVTPEFYEFGHGHGHSHGHGNDNLSGGGIIDAE